MQPTTEWTYVRGSLVSERKPRDHRQWNATGNVNRKAIVPDRRCASPSHVGSCRGTLTLPNMRAAVAIWIKAKTSATVANHTLSLMVLVKNNVSVVSPVG